MQVDAALVDAASTSVWAARGLIKSSRRLPRIMSGLRIICLTTSGSRRPRSRRPDHGGTIQTESPTIPIYIYICIHKFLYIHIFVFTYIYLFFHTYIFFSIFLFLFIFILIYLQILYSYLCIFVFIYMYHYFIFSIHVGVMIKDILFTIRRYADLL